MTEQVQKALDNLNIAYNEVIEIANKQIYKITKDADEVVKEISSNINNITNDNIQMYLLKLSTSAYSMSEVEERGEFRAELAESIRKEKCANIFNSSVGTVAQKENCATIEASGEIVAEELTNLVASSIKSKRDEIHRVVDTLKTIWINRLGEAKLSDTKTIGEVGEKTYLCE